MFQYKFEEFAKFSSAAHCSICVSVAESIELTFMDSRSVIGNKFSRTDDLFLLNCLFLVERNNVAELCRENNSNIVLNICH